MKILLELYITFFKIGLFSFGGGYAMLPLLERELVDGRKWVSKEEIYDYYAIGQATPGIISVNTSTFCGYKMKGVLGAFFASLGMISPSIIIIIIIANFLKGYQNLEIVKHAFTGIRIAVCALVLNTVIKMAKNTIKDKTSLIIMLFTFVTIAFFSISPAIIVIAIGIFGIILKRG
ncbi:MAG: chromate transporter [Tissierellia bacterium]|nr:chromate transporter [Tissierellia bacterium]